MLLFLLNQNRKLCCGHGVQALKANFVARFNAEAVITILNSLQSGINLSDHSHSTLLINPGQLCLGLS